MRATGTGSAWHAPLDDRTKEWRGQHAGGRVVRGRCRRTVQALFDRSVSVWWLVR